VVVDGVACCESFGGEADRFVHHRTGLRLDNLARLEAGAVNCDDRDAMKNKKQQLPMADVEV